MESSNGPFLLNGIVREPADADAANQPGSDFWKQDTTTGRVNRRVVGLPSSNATDCGGQQPRLGRLTAKRVLRLLHFCIWNRLTGTCLEMDL